MSKYMLRISVFTLATIGLTAQSIPIAQTITTFGMVGLAEGQTAQLNVLNPGVAPPAATGVICSAAVSFVNDQGTVIKSTTLNVPPGKSMTFSLFSDVDLNLAVNERREIRATIRTSPIFPPNASGTPTAAAGCGLFPTLEIYDNLSRKTQVVMGKLETVPSLVATPAN